MRKSIVLFIVGFIFISSVGVGAITSPFIPTSSQGNEQSIGESRYDDELDQSMTSYEGFIPIGWYPLDDDHYVNVSVAQAFIPTKEVLTRVQFFMAKNSTTLYPCSLEVRENLTGETLAAVQVDPSEFPLFDPEHPENLSWITFDVSDLWVTPGDTYYLVLSTINVTDNYYYCGGNGSNVYPNGTVFISFNDEQTWEEYPDIDGCFQTFGLRETFLDITSTPGPFGFSYEITNIGNVTAWDVEAGVRYSGGIFGLINKTFIVTTDQLEVNQSILLASGLVVGLGPIHIKVWVRAVNVKEISATVDGIIFLFFIIIK